MRAVGSPLEMCHAVDTSEGRPPALVAMAVELFLGKNITAALQRERGSQLLALKRRAQALPGRSGTSQENETMPGQVMSRKR